MDGLIFTLRRNLLGMGHTLECGWQYGENCDCFLRDVLEVFDETVEQKERADHEEALGTYGECMRILNKPQERKYL